MKPVGIIINPASGKDIRRLVASGSTFDNTEKVRIVTRIIHALDEMGVAQAYLMPDYDKLSLYLLDNLKCQHIKVDLIDMECFDTAGDSRMAAQMMNTMGVGCVICLGGDGTSRVVAKGCGDTPMLPLSTGTNNVFPLILEGTVAGMAAAVIAHDVFDKEEYCIQAPILQLCKDNTVVNMGLVDIAIIEEQAGVGSLAVWDENKIKELFLTRANPINIGLSAIGGYIHPMPAQSGKGLHVTIGKGGQTVRVPLAPGMVKSVNIASTKEILPGETIPLAAGEDRVVAFDGEREQVINDEPGYSIRLNPRGPWVVDVDKLMRLATDKGIW